MKIPNKTLKKWNELKQRGDMDALATMIGKSDQTVYAIFRNGEAMVEDAEKINEFFKERERRAEKLAK